MQGIYFIINTINGKVYVGSSRDVKSRWREHRSTLRRNKHRNEYLQNAWNKEGENAFVFTCAEQTGTLPEAELLEREQHWIESAIAADRSFGYNLRPTALRSVISEDTRLKLRNANLGKRHSEETKAKLSASLTGKPGWNTGMKMSDDFRQKCKARQLGKTLSAETRKRLSESHRGKPTWTLGKSLSAEHRKHVGAASKSRWADPEYKARLSAAHKARWAKIKSGGENNGNIRKETGDTANC